ncbi:phospholipid phosphatase 2-like isoform X2 [Arctopsyche grandis]|uniref:phospholipid phosphatase 2-like isoform X2 n=1 Tax=Arctopsyche grandis TaxID=121162 RepID=UPI00406D9111
MSIMWPLPSACPNLHRELVLKLMTRDGKEGDVVGPGRELPRVNQIPPCSIKRRPLWRLRWPFFVNLLIILLVGAFLILHEFNYLPNHRSGFYCGDPKISFPFDGDTITVVNLLLMCAFAPAIIMIIVELLRYRPEKYSMSNVRCKTALKNVNRWYGEYVVSLVFNLFLLEVIKGIIGEPRPHFLQTCNPDAAVNCTPGTYISTYTCTNTQYSKWFVRDTIKSFPSGHTAIGLSTSIFLFCYLQKRACDLRPKLMTPLIQALLISWGLACSCTRIMDNRHHWWDVLGGAVLGFIMSYYNVMILCKNFKCPNPQLARSVNSNGDSGRSMDSHHSIKRHINSSTMMPDEFDSGLRQIT